MMWQFFSFGGGGRGRPWGQQLAHSVPVQEEEEEGRMGRLAAGPIGPKVEGKIISE
jgi:hypothetical protein